MLLIILLLFLIFGGFGGWRYGSNQWGQGGGLGLVGVVILSRDGVGELEESGVT